MELENLIDFEALREVMEEKYATTGMPVGVVDLDTGEIYIDVGWRRICQQFHRKNPQSNIKCLESDTVLKDNLRGNNYCRYKCGNGLWDIGIPVTIKGAVICGIFIGQFFYKGEQPDFEYFMNQGLRYGYDIDDYLSALNDVPVFPREKVEEIIDFYRDLALSLEKKAEKILKG